MHKVALALALTCLTAMPALADDRSCLAEAMYHEARDQGWLGMLAVGVVIQNRVRSPRYPDDVCSVVRQGRYWEGQPVRNKCQFSYYCDGKTERPSEPKAWNRAMKIADLLLFTRVEVAGLEGATHYHSTSVQPSWSTVLVKREQIGEHIFYARK